MAKISFTKLISNKSFAEKTIKIGEEEVIVKTRLTADETIAFLTELMDSVFDNDGFISPMRDEIYRVILTIKYFTNINITDTMMKNATKTYDSIIQNNLMTQVLDAIDTDYKFKLSDLIAETERKIQEYNTSFVGWVKSSLGDKELAEMDLTKTLEEISNNPNFETVKQVVEQLG